MMGALFVIYLAGADALYLARLGAYATLAEIDAQPAPTPAPEPEPTLEPQPSAPLNLPTTEWETRPERIFAVGITVSGRQPLHGPS